MLPSEIDFIRQCLPTPLAFPYFDDRESPWLLAHSLTAPARVADLRRGPLGRFLDRPAVRPVVAACGGRLCPSDLRLVAAGGDASGAPTRAATAGLEAAYAHPWHDFELTFADWGLDDPYLGSAYSMSQISRPGGNLVLQMGFPSDHAALMGRYTGRNGRKDFEYARHPIRETGRPTLAWARLDIDLENGVALIEEVQSDWLRYAREEVGVLERLVPRSRELRVARTYDAQLRDRYGRLWPKAVLLAVLRVLVEDLGCRDVWMHQPEPGAILKGIYGRMPPRSLYSKLPKAFGFAPTQDMPALLTQSRKHKPDRARMLKLDRVRRAGEPLFWRLQLPPTL